MSKILFVTSMNDSLYEEYAHLFLKEFNQYAGKDIHMINFVDKGSTEIFKVKYDKIDSKLLNCELHERFLRFYGNIASAKGIRIKLDKDTGKYKVQFSYQFNAITYSYKVFAMNKAFQFAKNNNYDYLIWSDADMRCKKKFTLEDLEEFLPNKDDLMSYLGRSHFPTPPHSETGFLAFNIMHTEFNNFINSVINTYMTGKVFTFDQFHDCWVFDRVREEYEQLGYKFKNLSGDYAYTEHPFINTNLGLFFDHLKGPSRKSTLKSHDNDYVNK